MASWIPSPLSGYRLILGETIQSILALINPLNGNGAAQPISVSNFTQNGVLTVTPQVIAAAGQTQGSATAITSGKAVVTAVATATHNGVQLPVASTGLEVEVVSGVTPGGFKVYPASGGKIGAATTNSADTTNLAALKTNRYIAVNKTLWSVQRGS